jgi:hypothetical protein
VTSILLQSNAELTKRLARLETCFDACDSVLTSRPASLLSFDTITRYNTNAHMDTITEDFRSLTFGGSTDSLFQRELEQSRVYRKATCLETDASYRSSVVRSHAWTTLSDISLSDISAISVVALPLQATDITNAQHYTFSGPVSELDDTFTSSAPNPVLHRIVATSFGVYDPMFKAAKSRESENWTLIVHGAAGSGALALIDKVRVHGNNFLYEMNWVDQARLCQKCPRVSLWSLAQPFSGQITFDLLVLTIVTYSFTSGPWSTPIYQSMLKMRKSW